MSLTWKFDRRGWGVGVFPVPAKHRILVYPLPCVLVAIDW